MTTNHKPRAAGRWTMWMIALGVVTPSLALADDASDAPAFQPAVIKAPDGYTVELAAAPPLVRHPVMAGFDYQGRLFVAEPDGHNLHRADLEKQLPGQVRRLEDTDGDGVFDKATVFADKLTFPQGALWHDGALYVCSSGALWKFIDTNDDGRADKRIKLVGDFGYTGNAADVHGPFLGPDGRIWWCEGRHGHEIKDKTGKVISKGKAARIFNCKTDGTDVQTWCTGGMDNPVEIVFTPEGDVIGTVNLMYARPRGDCLVHWVYGGVYPRKDFVDKLSSEFIFTGDLLPEIHNFGHVALSGLCLYRSEHFGPNPAFGRSPLKRAAPKGPDAPYILYITQFNTHKVLRVELSRKGSTYAATKIEDFLTSNNKDVHFTDVLEDADGSLLVIDTGGWFRIGCPVSQVAKPDIHGAIYRIRKKGGKKYADPRGLKLDWAVPPPLLSKRTRDDRFVVRRRAQRLLRERKAGSDTLIGIVAFPPGIYLRHVDPDVRRREIEEAVVQQLGENVAVLLDALSYKGTDRLLEHAIIYAMIRSDDRKAVAEGLKSDSERVRRAAAIALEQMRRKREPEKWLIDVPAPSAGVKLEPAQAKALIALKAALPAGDARRGAAVFTSKEAACATCHRVKGEGGQFGPDLSTVGAIRARQDLIESIIYPSSSFARGFEPYTVRTKEGDVHNGIILGEKRNSLTLSAGKDKTVSVKADQIESLRPSDVSIMPQGMDKALTRQQLADLLAYLLSLK